MRTIVVGMGVQGPKRRRAAGDDFVGSVDPAKPDADYRRIEDVPLTSYDAALLCVPDSAKPTLTSYLLSNGKHLLVEKPLWVERSDQFDEWEELAQRKGVVLYTAYNHRFEPHYVRMRDHIASGALGPLYRCRVFYGNGTARLVRDSQWRDRGAGVLPDLGSHMLDTIQFWFGDVADDFRVVSASCFENRAADHVVIASEASRPKIEIEMTLLMWRNHFTCDVLGERGTAHITSLCKWGPTQFTTRTRVLPSGPPMESSITLVQPDPTWNLEYAHFRLLCERGAKTDLARDRYLHRVLSRLCEAVVNKAC